MMKSCIIFIGFFLFFAAASCAEEENPHRGTQQKGDPNKEETLDDGLNKSTDNPTDTQPTTKETEQQPSVGNRTDADATSVDTGDPKNVSGDIYDEACDNVKGLSLNADVKRQLAYLCKDGKATPKFRSVASNPYTGGDVGTIAPESLGSEGNETQITAITALKVPMTAEEVFAKKKDVVDLDTDVNDVEITNTILSTEPNDAGFTIQSEAYTVILFIPITDITVVQVRYGENNTDKMKFSYTYLKEGEDDNSDNKGNSSVVFTLQTGEKETTVVSVRHQMVNNRGIAAGSAEDRIEGQIPGLLKANYDLLVGE